MQKKIGGDFLTGNTPSVADFCASSLYVNAKKFDPETLNMIKIYDSLTDYFIMIDKLIVQKSKTGGFAGIEEEDSDGELSPIENDPVSDDEKDGILNSWMGHKHDEDHQFFAKLREKLED